MGRGPESGFVLRTHVPVSEQDSAVWREVGGMSSPRIFDMNPERGLFHLQVEPPKKSACGLAS